MCVWAAGTSPRPLTQMLAKDISPSQVSSVSKTGRLKVDPWLRVIGLEDRVDSDGRKMFGRIFTLGDAGIFPWTVDYSDKVSQYGHVRVMNMFESVINDLVYFNHIDISVT